MGGPVLPIKPRTATYITVGVAVLLVLLGHWFLAIVLGICCGAGYAYGYLK